MLKRRHFLLGSSAVIGSGLILSSIPAAALVKKQKYGAKSALSVYKAKLNKTLSVYTSDGQYVADIKLTRVNATSTPASNTQFSLSWEVQNSEGIKEGLYVLDDFTDTPEVMYLQTPDTNGLAKTLSAHFNLTLARR